MRRSHTLRDLDKSSSEDSFSTESSSVDLHVKISEQNYSFNSSELRKSMEPFLRKARLQREQTRSPSALQVHASIADSLGVPYPQLRSERRFLFDEHTHPLHEALSTALEVDLHSVKKTDLLKLHERYRRLTFQRAYDSFVTSFCIPLLHSVAISKAVLPYSAQSVTYQYQAFPDIHHGESFSPVCDSILGHSLHSLTFYIPLTASTNCLFCESFPGREDWHSLNAKSVGLGYLFDGARCLYFGMDNPGVGLLFRVMISKSDRRNDGFFDEAIVDLQGAMPIRKRHPHRLLEPDERNGYPF